MRREQKFHITFRKASKARDYAFSQDFQGEVSWHTDNIISVVTWKRKNIQRMKYLAGIYGAIAIRKVS